MEGTVLLLVGMSVREVDARDRLREQAEQAVQAVQAVQAAGEGAAVAFLQLGDPSLSAALTRLADADVEAVELVGVSLGTLAPAGSWLRRVAGHWWRQRAGHRPSLTVATRLLDRLEPTALHDVRREARVVTGAEPGLTSAAWEEVTRHRHQLLLCRGPRCTARGSDATAEAVVLALAERGLGDDDVLVTHTGCLLPCNQAPVVAVQPADTWYGAVSPAVGRRIVAEHLVAGEPVVAHRLPRHHG